MNNFCQLNREHVLETEYFFVIFDEHPVANGHCLIISKNIKRDYFELEICEKIDLICAIQKTKYFLDVHYKPDGYNIGMNCDAAAGQTVFHFHCHVIPRYYGDMENPGGGVRYCIPSKGNY